MDHCEFRGSEWACQPVVSDERIDDVCPNCVYWCSKRHVDKLRKNKHGKKFRNLV